MSGSGANRSKTNDAYFLKNFNCRLKDLIGLIARENPPNVELENVAGGHVMKEKKKVTS